MAHKLGYSQPNPVLQCAVTSLISDGCCTDGEMNESEKLFFYDVILEPVFNFIFEHTWCNGLQI